jgi:hypothetical protein
MSDLDDLLSIEVSAFPDPDELKDILLKYKYKNYNLEQAMFAIEKMEEANIRFQNLALSQAQIRLMVEAKEEQHKDFTKLIELLNHPPMQIINKEI